MDLIKSGKIDIIFNTPLGRESFYDDTAIRKSATLHGVLVVTTLTAAAATVQAIQALRERALDIVSLQEIHVRRRRRAMSLSDPPAKPLAVRGASAAAAPTPPPTRACCARWSGRGCPWPGIAGVSGGALVAAAWAGGADLDEPRGPGLAPASLDVGARLGRRPPVGHAAGRADRRVPARLRFEGLRVPVRVLATDVDTGEPVVFREGDVREAVRASCSFPGVFPPMVIGGPPPLRRRRRRR